MADLRRDKVAYDEAIRRALEVRKAAAAHRRGKPIAFPTGRRP